MYVWYNTDLESLKSKLGLSLIQKAACLFHSLVFGSHFDSESVNVAAENRVYFYALRIEAMDCDNIGFGL